VCVCVGRGGGYVCVTHIFAFITYLLPTVLTYGNVYLRWPFLFLPVQNSTNIYKIVQTCADFVPQSLAMTNQKAEWVDRVAIGRSREVVALTHTHTRALSLSLSHTHTLSLTPSHTHTHAHAHAHTHKHTHKHTHSIYI
jgi:hypothetical protein